jgi:hypothetical protein
VKVGAALSELIAKGLERKSWMNGLGVGAVSTHIKPAFTRVGVNGTWRNRIPVASNTAFANAAATGAQAASPAPFDGWSG